METVVSVVLVPGGSWSYYAGKVYTPKPRRDGVVTYRAGKRVTADRRSYDKAKREAKVYASEHDLEFVEGVTHGTPCF
jgi:hypothetical protein